MPRIVGCPEIVVHRRAVLVAGGSLVGRRPVFRVRVFRIRAFRRRDAAPALWTTAERARIARELERVG
jgi:hypothetical protein